MGQSPLDIVRDVASKYPEAEQTTILGDHEVFRVKKKVYVWLGDAEGGEVYVSVKLKDTQQAALMLPFVEPAAYGMAKWGWIRATFPKNKFPTELVKEWIDESYRHTAPKKLLKQLDAGNTAPAATATRSRSAAPKRAASRGAPAKKPAAASRTKKKS